MGRVLAIALLTSAAASAGTFFGLRAVNNGGGRRATSEVPKLAGMSLPQARAMLDAKGLRLTVFERRADQKQPADHIISHAPLAGSQIEQGAAVYAIVSSGRTSAGSAVAIPAVTGVTVQAAKGRLAKAGLAARIAYQGSTAVAAGTVISAIPKAGSKLPAGGTVTLLVSSGASAAAGGAGSSGVAVPGATATPQASGPQQKVPKVTYRRLSRARSLIGEAGFSVGRIRYKTDEDRVDDLVLGQSPEPGSMAAKGSAIDLVVNETDY